MFNVSGGEVIVILVLALVVLGPEKMPEMLRKAGRLYGELRRMATGFQSEFEETFAEPLREFRDTANQARDMILHPMDQVGTDPAPAVLETTEVHALEPVPTFSDSREAPPFVSHIVSSRPTSLAEANTAWPQVEPESVMSSVPATWAAPAPLAVAPTLPSPSLPPPSAGLAPPAPIRLPGESLSAPSPMTLPGESVSTLAPPAMTAAPWSPPQAARGWAPPSAMSIHDPWAAPKGNS